MISWLVGGQNHGTDFKFSLQSNEECKELMKDRIWKLSVKSNHCKNLRRMELALQFAYKISKKILEPAYHWYEFGGFRFTFKRFLKFQVTEVRNLSLLFQKLTRYSVNKQVARPLISWGWYRKTTLNSSYWRTR